MSIEISEYSKEIINNNKERIELFRMNLIPASKLRISDEKALLSTKMIEIISLGKDYISKAAVLPENHKLRLNSAVGSYSSGRQSAIERKSINLISLTSSFLNNKKIMTNSLENALKILDPENVLKRGYTITSLNGKIIKSSGETAEDDIIDTRFSDGTIKSKVI
jgi:exodeoxyribonuclease VII large subunit